MEALPPVLLPRLLLLLPVLPPVLPPVPPPPPAVVLELAVGMEESPLGDGAAEEAGGGSELEGSSTSSIVEDPVFPLQPGIVRN